ncbi:ferredoxin [Paractinoplanes hotanensis]|uniref:Ferredoxin n=1 Tax=Paractinoplanes hotanensis TaxID=2906497 RepID=A0ABT0XXB1_9ACTN|nr:ferredoxin [Actinoplanes hotanensis]MCM4078430.1 ferredoxin [Actinoplanes hotanensis]
MNRLHVDWTACDGRGLCAELLPELLVEDDWGYPVPRGDMSVPPALEPAARQAVDRCPALALRLTRVVTGPAPV